MKIVIVQRESESFNLLIQLLEETLPFICTLEHADTVKSAVNLIKSISPNLLLMGSILKDGNAFDVFKKVQFFDCKIFFVGEFNKHTSIASKKQLTTFLLKSIHNEKKHIPECVSNKQNNCGQSGDSCRQCHHNIRLFLPKGNEHVAVKTEDIIKCVADGNFTCFYLTGQKHYVSQPIKHYDMLLSDKGFFRINRSVLINTKYIKLISKKEAIILTNNEKLMVSRRNKEKLKRLINSFS